MGSDCDIQIPLVSYQKHNVSTFEQHRRSTLGNTLRHVRTALYIVVGWASVLTYSIWVTPALYQEFWAPVRPKVRTSSVWHSGDANPSLHPYYMAHPTTQTAHRAFPVPIDPTGALPPPFLKIGLPLIGRKAPLPLNPQEQLQTLQEDLQLDPITVPEALGAPPVDILPEVTEPTADNDVPAAEQPTADKSTMNIPPPVVPEVRRRKPLIDLKVDLSALFEDAMELHLDASPSLFVGLFMLIPFIGAASLYFLYWNAKRKKEKEQEEGKEEERIIREKWKPPVSRNDVPTITLKPLEFSEGPGTLIVFDPNTMTFWMNARSFTYAFRVNELQELEHLHWGAKLDPNEDLAVAQLNSRWAKQHMDWIPVVCGDPGDGALQRNVFLHEWSDYGTGDYRRASYVLRHANGSNVSSMKYYSHKIVMGKPVPVTPGMAAMYTDNLDDAQTLVITMFDEVQDVFADLHYTIFRDSNVMVRKVIITNATNKDIAQDSDLYSPIDTDALMESEFAGALASFEDGEIHVSDPQLEETQRASYISGEAKTLESIMSVTADFEASEGFNEWHVTTLDGAYERERQKSVQQARNGTISIGSRRGQSSHQHNPFMLLSQGPPRETEGECYAFNLVYSGNFLGEVEMTETGRLRLSMGIHPDTFSWYLEPGQRFESPEVAMVWTDKGCGEISRELHRAYHKRLYKGLHVNRPRPILVNTWEATYFSIEHKNIVNMARRADLLGIDLVVLDDGWFGERNNDTSSLGDWDIINYPKLPYGLDGLALAVRAQGVLFGLWIEPESISENSHLYREHPDWCIHTENRPRTRGRNQLLLDFGRAEVRQYIIDILSKILSMKCRDTDEALISYVKWDMNRCITEAGSPILPPERQGEVMHRHILGLYEVLQTITRKFPGVLFEGCAQGGGRLDPGILCFMPQIWTSDNTDFADRLRIQFGTSLAYPLSTTTAHVSTVPNHQTGRYSSLRGRALLAMAGGIGWELDLRQLSEADRRAAIAYNKYYRLIANLVLYGELYRLWDPFADETRLAAWMMVNERKTEAVAFAFIAWRKPYQFYPMLRMQGLEEDAMYILETLQPEEAMCSKEEYKMYQLKSLIMSPTPQVVKLVVEVLKKLGPGGVLRMNAAVEALKKGDFKPLEDILRDPAEYGVQVAYDALCEVEQDPELFGITINHGAMRSLNGKEMKGSTLMNLGVPIQFESDMDGVVLRMRKVGSTTPPVTEWQPNMGNGGTGPKDWLVPR